MFVQCTTLRAVYSPRLLSFSPLLPTFLPSPSLSITPFFTHETTFHHRIQQKKIRSRAELTLLVWNHFNSISIYLSFMVFISNYFPPSQFSPTTTPETK